MIRILALIVGLLLSVPLRAQDTTAVSLPAQERMVDQDDEPAGPPLNAIQLERQKWYYSIDEAIREPEKVYKLSLSREKLKAFPYDITRFKNLQVLNLSYNNIREVPDQIAELPNLQIIILTHNRIRALPDEMAELDNLEALYLANNKLVAMPSWVGGLSKLRKLDLAYNQLSDYELAMVRYRLPKCEVTH